MNWHKLIDWQITSFGGNPAVMVEVTNGNMDSVRYTDEQVNLRNLRYCIQTHFCLDEEAEEFAKNFKPGAVSFAFINGVHDYEHTMKNLRAIYDLVHYNSLLAGSGLDHAEVKRAVDDFCKEKAVPWREFSPGVWAIHHCHREGQ